MIIVFLGPTVPAEEARNVLDALYLPPVSQGDVYRAAQRRPEAIGIVDGYFDQVPAVWHKEILWALKQGIRVYGSSSMGALRAAELAPFGMIGVGDVFTAFREGVLNDDDEVAVRHGDGPDYRLLSVAMVSIRATLVEAERQGVVSPATRQEMETIAKDTYYPERSYRRLLDDARQRGLPQSERAALESWLPANTVDQKKKDAMSMLELMREDYGAQKSPQEAQFEFQNTTLWDELCRSAGQLMAGAVSSLAMVPEQAVLTELRLLVNRWHDLERAAFSRRLAIMEIRRRQIEITDDMIHQAITDLRRQRGLETSEDVMRWIAENELTPAGFLSLMQQEAGISELKSRLRTDLGAELVDIARMEGLYPALSQRAGHKLPILADVDVVGPPPELYEAAASWFAECHNSSSGDRADARALGFTTTDEMQRAILGEYLLQKSE
jgi:hypothetical protein